MAHITLHRPGIPVPLTVARGGTGQTTLPGLQTALGLGSMAYQQASAVAITGGSAVGLTQIGIGTATPTAPLTFATTEGHKIGLYGTTYGLGIGPGRTQLYGDSSGGVALGTRSGMTFTPTLDLVSASVGIATGAQSTHRLIVAAGKTVWQVGSTVGINVEPGAALHVTGPGDNSNVIGHGFQAPDYAPGTPNRVGFYSLVNAGTNCWGVLHAGSATSQFNGRLNVGGHSQLFTLSVNRADPIGHDMYVGWMAADRIGASVGNRAAQWALEVGAPAHISQLGVYYGPPSTVWFRTASAALDSLSLARGDAAPRWTLDCEGHGYIQRLGAAYGPDGNYAIRASNCWFDSAGFGYAGGSGYTIRAGNAHIDHLGVGTPPYGGWSIAGNQILAWAALQSSGTLYVVGASTITSSLDVHANLLVRGSEIRCYQNMTIHLDSGFRREPIPGWSIAGTAINMTTYDAQKASGGPWQDSSSRRLKRNIRQITGALGLLLAQRGTVYEWDEPHRAQILPGPRYGFIQEECTIPQWLSVSPSGETLFAATGFEAMAIEAMRELHQRLATLEQRENHP